MEKPTPKQLRYLKRLAERTGGTFAYPQTKAEASREIERLKSRPSSARSDVVRERRAVSDDSNRATMEMRGLQALIEKAATPACQAEAYTATMSNC